MSTQTTNPRHTFATVPTETPPPLDAESASIAVDIQDGFMNVRENGGKYPAQLPVEGSVARVPNILQVVKCVNTAGILSIATQDTHIAKDNPTVASSYVGVDPKVNTWVSAADAPQVLGSQIRVADTATFTVEMLLKWVAMLPAGGYMIWVEHVDPDSPLHRIHPPVHALLVRGNNFVLIRKGEQESRLIPGLKPESYSVIKMSTGESLGVGEMIRARGAIRVYVFGFCGDFCAGETALDLAELGFEVWVIVDAQECVKVPNFAGTDMTSEEHMIQRMLQDPRIHFCTTAEFVSANAGNNK